MTEPTGLERLWYGPAWRSAPLWPLEVVFRAATALRRRLYRIGVLPRLRVGVPVVVVGNLTVGGAGKTPVSQWLAGELGARGLRTAVVLRGYGGRQRGAPIRVTREADPALVGDEAVLHARHGALVFVAADRVAAATEAARSGAQIVVSDDGLQHLRLARDFEIVVVDGARGFGNGHLLPAGPLREPAGRLREAGAIVLTDRGAVDAGVAARVGPRAVRAALRPAAAVNLASGARVGLETFRDRKVQAVAGIGHPEAFFAALRGAGLEIEPHALADHARIDPGDPAFASDAPVLMTEKDAVKCAGFARPGWWYVELDVSVEPAAAVDLVKRVLDATGLGHGRGERLG